MSHSMRQLTCPAAAVHPLRPASPTLSEHEVNTFGHRMTVSRYSDSLLPPLLSLDPHSDTRHSFDPLSPVDDGLDPSCKSMVYERSTIALVAKFAYEVLEVFYATPVFRPISTEFYRMTGDWYSGILPETDVPKRDRAV
ncbi:hypothetical protein B0H17DRAFT_1143773 [Mycena rosella]|uniref:Uncharacterized protein n=1 Tax=Mycena rosella TaxID=1033263 RepID=A0AAD7G456_MYCRO|nr:hypothetical protein B0H17DRAFT_1143773 [Mycena rosella]